MPYLRSARDLERPAPGIRFLRASSCRASAVCNMEAARDSSSGVRKRTLLGGSPSRLRGI